MFAVRIAGDRILLTATGLWDPVDLEEASTKLVTAVRHFSDAGREFDLLSDLTSWATQTKVIAQGAEALSNLLQQSGLRRGASVVGSALTKMQLQRIAGYDPRYRFFLTVAEAAEWLDQTPQVRAKAG